MFADDKGWSCKAMAVSPFSVVLGVLGTVIDIATGSHNRVTNLTLKHWITVPMKAPPSTSDGWCLWSITREMHVKNAMATKTSCTNGKTKVFLSCGKWLALDWMYSTAKTAAWTLKVACPDGKLKCISFNALFVAVSSNWKKGHKITLAVIWWKISDLESTYVNKKVIEKH